MKLMFVGNTSWSMWNFRKEVMFALKESGHSIFVLAPEDKDSILLKENFNYIPILNLSRKGLNPLKDLKLLFELYKKYKKYQPDFVFQYTIKPNIYGSLAAHFAKVKAISFVTGLGYVFTNKTMLRGLVVFLYRLSAVCAEKLVFLNHADRLDYIQHKIVSYNKTALLPGEGVDTEYFKPTPKKNRTPSNAATFIFVGRLLIDKGILFYLSAAEKVKSIRPEVTFQIIGGIDDGNPMAIKIEDLKPFIESGVVTYIGEVRDVRIYLDKADALILPSFAEGLSRVILEALSMETPVLCSDIRGCNDLVKHGENGFLISINELDQLDKLILEFLELPSEVRKKMGEIGRNLITQKFSTKQVIQYYFDTFLVKGSSF